MQHSQHTLSIGACGRRRAREAAPMLKVNTGPPPAGLTDHGIWERAQAAGVDSTPTFLLYRDGSRVATVGTASPTLLRRNLEDNFT